MSKNLVIVESPAKAKTIEGYLGKDYTVRSSFGHVRDLPSKDMGIDIKNGFMPAYEVSADKVKVINELKKLVKESDEVWLATDDDREGEAISWHLKEALGLKNDAKRIVFREITKSALQKAIANPRTINFDLVNAQQARRVLDRLVGYELSPVLWRKVKTGTKGLSAGRVQSVAVRVIVEREREIDAHNSTSSYKVTALFDLVGGKVLSAELPKNFETEAQAVAFVNRCKSAVYTIKNLEVKPAKKTPAPPFTTSTLQQEASRKLSFSVLQTMTVAQKLYEAGKISYMRTDSTNLSEEALEKAKVQITTEYGEKYYNKRVFKTKSESAQEAHEAIRPTDFGTTQSGGDRNEQRLYELIWKRAIASQMADAQLERTVATIGISTTPEDLIAQGEVIKFDGFLKVYLESKDEEEEDTKGMLPPLNIGQIIDLNHLKATERFSRPAPRYTEASLVKKLEELGIGRPSTYAPTITTIIKREYIIKQDRDGQEREFKEITLLKSDEIKTVVGKEKFGSEKAKLFPTNTGMVVTDFLIELFTDIVDFSFTANIEKEFDEIADGKLGWQKMIDTFYKGFHPKIEEVGSGEVVKNSKTTNRELGIDPATGKMVSVKMGKFGPYAQLGDPDGEEKPKSANLKKDQLLENITLADALNLFSLPREVGFFEDKPMVVAVGKYGPYVKFDEKFYSLDRSDDPYTVEADRCIGAIRAKRGDLAAEEGLGELEGLPIISGMGRFGPYVKHNDKYYSLPKGSSIAGLTPEEAVVIIMKKRETESNKNIKEFPENPAVKVLRGPYGPYIAIGKRNIKIPKDTDPASLTLEDCLKLAEGK
jgi:DNA topoisomerase I